MKIELSTIDKIALTFTGMSLLVLGLLVVSYRINNPVDEKPENLNKSIFAKNSVKPDSIWVDPDLITIKIFKGDTTIYINTEYFLNK